MPKSSTKWSSPPRGCCGTSISRNTTSPPATFAGSLFFSTPRKVSFEDSRSDSNSSISSDATPNSDADQQQQQQHPLRRKRSLLVRPIASLSLVDLAKSAAAQEEEQQDETSSSSSSTDEVLDEYYGERKAKRICSPRSTIPSDQAIVPPLSPTQHQAPWGQFVDMLVPEEEECNTTSSFLPGPYHQCYYHDSSRCQVLSSSCRSRRSSPYGDYIAKQSHTKKGPIPNTLCLSASTLDSKSTFRLTPRTLGPTRSKEPTEQLIGAFSGLNF
jgi:hypothetical protein